MDVGWLAGDLGKQNFSRTENSLLRELDYVAIGKFVAFFFKRPFIAEELVFIVIGDSDIFFLDLFYYFPVFNLVF